MRNTKLTFDYTNPHSGDLKRYQWESGLTPEEQYELHAAPHLEEPQKKNILDKYDERFQTARREDLRGYLRCLADTQKDFVYKIERHYGIVNYPPYTRRLIHSIVLRMSQADDWEGRANNYKIVLTLVNQLEKLKSFPG